MSKGKKTMAGGRFARPGTLAGLGSKPSLSDETLPAALPSKVLRDASLDINLGVYEKIGHAWPHGMNAHSIRWTGATETVRQSGLTHQMVDDYVAEAVKETIEHEKIRHIEIQIEQAGDAAVQACMAMVGQQLAKYDRIRLKLTGWVKQYDDLLSIAVQMHNSTCNCSLCESRRVIRDDIDAFWKANP